MKNIKVAILYSGKGSNIRPLVDMIEKPDSNAECVAIISNRFDSERMLEFNSDYIETEGELSVTLKYKYDVDLVLLCGYDTILSYEFVCEFQDRILNIHPSMLPAYRGKHALERIFDNSKSWLTNDKTCGATVHMVDDEVDTGRVLKQQSVGVFASDTFEDLRARVLKVENVIYPETVKLFINEYIIKQRDLKEIFGC